MTLNKANAIQVKICGLTDPEQAAICAQLGAHAVGLIFYPPSPRNVSYVLAKEIVAHLPERTLPVGVFVNADYDAIMRRVDICGLRAVQLHGQEPHGLAQRLAAAKLLVLKALFLSKDPDLNRAAAYPGIPLLVESGLGRLPGGNAQTWDWSQVRQLASRRSTVLAGGLAPGNVVAAIEGAQAHAVDVSSGVETTPGDKDLRKVKLLIDNVKKCNINYDVSPIFGINAHRITQSSGP